jgi:phosphoglycolate phosphatase
MEICVKFNSLFFDLDGTLTDPRAGIVACIRFALDELGVYCPADDLLKNYIGPPLRGTFSTLLGTTASDQIELAMNTFRLRFADKGLFENELYDGVPGMLSDLRKATDAMYIATSKPAVYAQRIVEHFGIERHFRKVYGSELDGRHDNKAELLAHLIEAERLFSPTAVMIGDRDVDVLAAKAVGIQSIGVLWGYGSEEELSDAGADIICSTPRDLVRHLDVR